MFGSKSYSLAKRISLSLLGVYLVMLVFMFLNNYLAIRILRQKLYHEMSDSLTRANTQITAELGNASNYLATFAMDSSWLPVLVQNKKDTNYYSALYQVKTDLSNTLSSLSILQGLFIFPTTSQEFLYANVRSKDALTAQSIRSLFREALNTGTLSDYVRKGWYPLELDGRTYILRVLKIGTSYAGAWTDVSSLLSRIEETPSIEKNAFFLGPDQVFYDASSQNLSPEHVSLPGERISLASLYGEACFYVEASVSWAQGNLCLFVPQSQITKNLIGSYLFTGSVSFCFLLFGIILAFASRRWLTRPLSSLQHSIDCLRQGDFSVRVPTNYECREFSEVNSAFNQMVERIENLKISVYEEKLSQQQTQLQALKNQIAPHFLINCLNAIYHMTAIPNTDGIRKMTVYLGEHLRYALADVSVVPLNREIEMVRNYAALSEIRFPGSIALILEVDDLFSEIPVPPMILLFQVENIVKYEVVNGELTEIHIEITRNTACTTAELHICIWDTGSGYATDILAQLLEQNMLSQSDGHNIGTKNIYQRLHLLFSDSFRMNFSNRKDAGAQVDIYLPFPLEKTPEGAYHYEPADCR